MSKKQQYLQTSYQKINQQRCVACCERVYGDLPSLCYVSSSRMFDILLGTAANKLRWLAFYLRNSSLLQFRSLVDIAVVDKLLVNGRFSINYLFLSMRTNQRLTVRLFADVTSPVLSLSVMFAGGVRFTSAVWLEREVWDMFGLYFSEHEDLRRILTDYGFSGHPLRKDFPLTGFYELVYNDAEGRIISEVVELAQEFRIFHI